MNTLNYIAEKYNLNINQRKQPIDIPNTTRVDLARLFFELKFTTGAEIGVEEGIYSEVLLQQNPKLEKLLSVDAWTAYEGYRDHMTQEEMDVIQAKAIERLKPFPNCIQVKAFSTDFAMEIPDESLDFVYLDANHEFCEVVNDIAAWERKVKVGGIVAGHDYIKRRTNNFLMHVPYAIDAYVSAYQIRPLFVLGRKEAKANLNPKRELRDSTRSWFYVKPKRDPMRPGYKQQA